MFSAASADATSWKRVGVGMIVCKIEGGLGSFVFRLEKQTVFYLCVRFLSTTMSLRSMPKKKRDVVIAV